MKLIRTKRNFEGVNFEDRYGMLCSLQQSSAVLEYDDALSRPGSSALWLGVYDARMHLDRETVRELAARMVAWLETGSLAVGGRTMNDERERPHCFWCCPHGPEPTDLIPAWLLNLPLKYFIPLSVVFWAAFAFFFWWVVPTGFVWLVTHASRPFGGP